MPAQPKRRASRRPACALAGRSPVKTAPPGIPSDGRTPHCRPGDALAQSWNSHCRGTLCASLPACGHEEGPRWGSMLHARRTPLLAVRFRGERSKVRPVPSCRRAQLAALLAFPLRLARQRRQPRPGTAPRVQPSATVPPMPASRIAALTDSSTRTPSRSSRAIPTAPTSISPTTCRPCSTTATICACCR